VGVDTELAHLPHFLAHYRDRGIAAEHEHTVLNRRDPGSYNLTRVRAILWVCGVGEPTVWVEACTSDTLWAQRRALQARSADVSAWIRNADVDELHEYPTDFATLLAECGRIGTNCVQGVPMDRVSARSACLYRP